MLPINVVGIHAGPGVSSSTYAHSGGFDGGYDSGGSGSSGQAPRAGWSAPSTDEEAELPLRGAKAPRVSLRDSPAAPYAPGVGYARLERAAGDGAWKDTEVSEVHDLSLPTTGRASDMAVVRTVLGWEPWVLDLTAKQRNRLVDKLGKCSSSSPCPRAHAPTCALPHTARACVQ